MRLPPEADEIRQSLVDEWIIRPSTTGASIDGLGAVMSAFWKSLQPIIGGLGARAVMTRAVYVAELKHQHENSFWVVEGGLDMARLHQVLSQQDEESAKAELAALVDALFAVLQRLLGPVFLPVVMPRVQEELANSRRSSRTRRGHEREDRS